MRFATKIELNPRRKCLKLDEYEGKVIMFELFWERIYIFCPDRVGHFQLAFCFMQCLRSESLWRSNQNANERTLVRILKMITSVASTSSEISSSRSAESGKMKLLKKVCNWRLCLSKSAHCGSFSIGTWKLINNRFQTTWNKYEWVTVFGIKSASQWRSLKANAFT